MTRVVAFQGGTLDNKAYGYPRGEKRRVKPWILACVHITGNNNTARMPVGIGPGSGTRAEVAYMARLGNPGGNSAHSYVARNGDMLDCIPWDDYAAWNNGDILTRSGQLARPNQKLASVQRIIRGLRRVGTRYAYGPRNVNEAFWWEVECTGSRSKGLGLTDEQITTVAQRIARISIRTGLPITRNTVLMHADIDGIDRLGCPWPAHQREQRHAALIKEAQTWKARFKKPAEPPEPPPDPDPPVPPDDCAEANEALVVANGRADDAEARVAKLTAVLGEVSAIVDGALEEDGP